MSYVKDTNDFLYKLASMEELPRDAILCTIDVISLDPSILLDEGLEALRTGLNLRDNQSLVKDTILKLANLVLPIFFEFDCNFSNKLGGSYWYNMCTNIFCSIFGNFRRNLREQS